jgi:hypothetical protein
MCQKRIAWADVDVDSLLAEADRINSLLPDFNATGYIDAGQTAAVQHPSRTYQVVAAAGLAMRSGTSFLLLVWTVILAIFGWFAFWLCPRRWSAVPLTLLAAALAMSAAGVAVLNVAVYRVAVQVATIDSQFARNPKTDPSFFGLLWSVVAMLALALLCAVIDITIGAREDDFNPMFKRLDGMWSNRGQEGKRINGNKKERREGWWSRFMWRTSPKMLEDDQASRQRLDPERASRTMNSQYSDLNTVDDISLDNVSKKTAGRTMGSEYSDLDTVDDVSLNSVTKKS